MSSTHILSALFFPSYVIFSRYIHWKKLLYSRYLCTRVLQSESTLAESECTTTRSGVALAKNRNCMESDKYASSFSLFQPIYTHQYKHEHNHSHFLLLVQGQAMAQVVSTRSLNVETPSVIFGHSVWDLWWKTWYWDRFYCQCSSPLSSAGVWRE